VPPYLCNNIDDNSKFWQIPLTEVSHPLAIIQYLFNKLPQSYFNLRVWKEQSAKWGVQHHYRGLLQHWNALRKLEYYCCAHSREALSWTSTPLATIPIPAG